MFISFVLIQVKQTKEKIKTPTGQFHLTLHIHITVGTGNFTSRYTGVFLIQSKLSYLPLKIVVYYFI
ncbi:MAG: hypothetical protein J7K51_02180 [Thermotogae bacterium]|nr:hypothetical protein [Thermotogota bacterium]